MAPKTNTTSDADLRLEAAKAKAAKPKRSKFKVVDHNPDNARKVAPLEEDRKPKPTDPTSGDQNDTHEAAPPMVPGDQNDTPEGDTPAKSKKPKTPSPTVVAWKMLEKPATNGVIRIMANYATQNPKRKTAGERFSYYRDGMTVQQYLDTMKAHGRTNAMCWLDIKWDIAAGFIDVEEPTS
jgi:hypothetical protein